MKAKGLIVKSFPKHWINWINPDKPNDKFTKEEIKFNNSILIEKRPMFMKYLYPTYKSKFKKHYDNYEYISYRKFGIHLEELLNIVNKTQEQQLIVDNYYRFNPLLDNDCVMNNICKHMENEISEIKININKKVPDYIFDILYNKNHPFTQIQLNDMEKIYKRYVKNNKSNNKIYNEEVNENIVDNNECDFLKFDKISDDIQVLANLSIYINYKLYPNSNKAFCWDLFSNGILLNIYDNSTKDFYIPICDNDGNINYMYKKYKNKKVNINYDNI